MLKNNKNNCCVSGKPRYALGDDVAFNFNRGHGKYSVHRGTIRQYQLSVFYDFIEVVAICRTRTRLCPEKCL